MLFSTSIRDNIAYGLSDCSLEQIQEAARRANAHDFISKLHNGYETGKQPPVSPSTADEARVRLELLL